MYVDTLMLVVGVSLFSVTFSIIQWAVNKGLDELYNKLIHKNTETVDFLDAFEEEEAEYYVAEREDK